MKCAQDEAVPDSRLLPRSVWGNPWRSDLAPREVGDVAWGGGCAAIVTRELTRRSPPPGAWHASCRRRGGMVRRPLTNRLLAYAERHGQHCGGLIVHRRSSRGPPHVVAVQLHRLVTGFGLSGPGVLDARRVNQLRSRLHVSVSDERTLPHPVLVNSFPKLEAHSFVVRHCPARA